MNDTRRSGGLLLLVMTLGSNRDVPDETQQFAPDRGHRLVLVLPARCEFCIAFVQTILGLPGDFSDFFSELEITLSSKQIAADPGAPLIRPCRFDNNSAEMRVAGFGDRTAFEAVSAGGFRCEIQAR